MLPFKLVYSDAYFLPIGKHVFPAEKYQRIRKRLVESGVAQGSDFVTPQPASDQDILLVHTPQYVQKLKTGTLSAREELEMEIPYSPELVRAFWLAAGGSMLAADYADQAVVQSPTAGTHQGRAAIEAVFRAWFDAFVDVKAYSDDLLIDGFKSSLHESAPRP